MQTNFRLEYDSIFSTSDPWQGIWDTSGSKLHQGPSISFLPFLQATGTTDHIIIM